MTDDELAAIVARAKLTVVKSDTESRMHTCISKCTYWG